MKEDQLPTRDENPTGLHQKYIVTKADGTPVDPEAEYFVLRIDSEADADHRWACLRALETYAKAIEPNIPRLACELIERYKLANPFIWAWFKMAEKTYGTHRAKGFAGPCNDGEQIALMHSELSEALEGLCEDLMDDKLPRRKMVEVELADVVIRIMNYGRERGHNIPGALIEKDAYNETREYRHGGKKF